MAKATGLGDNFYIGGFDVSGDTNSLSKISGGPAALDVTDITQSAYSRLGGLRDGGMDFVSYHDPAANASHAALSTLPTADVIGTYFRGTAVGNPAASCNAKQINYDPTRAADGMLTFAVNLQADAFGLEWGLELTPGIRTETGAVNSGTAIDNGASTSFGAQGYIHVFSFTGTNATIAIQDSPDNVTFTAIGGMNPTVSAAGAQRVVSSGSTINRYVRVAVPFGTFTSVSFAVSFVRNLTAVAF